MTRIVHILPFLAADGAEQMCRDEALLVCGPVPCLRLYRFDPATLSMGCFQDHAAVVAQLPRPIPVVRRITGGGAIWHEFEVTYAIVVELGRHGLPTRTPDLYPLLHRSVAASLAAAQLAPALQPVAVGDRRYHSEPRCFASPAADDLVLGEGKLLGSAARTRGNRVLVHGSLKLASNPWDGAAVAGCGLDEPTAQRRLREGLLAALGGGDPVETPWPDAVLAEAARLRQARYGDDGWVRERSGPRP